MVRQPRVRAPRWISGQGTSELLDKSTDSLFFGGGGGGSHLRPKAPSENRHWVVWRPESRRLPPCPRFFYTLLFRCFFLFFSWLLAFNKVEQPHASGRHGGAARDAPSPQETGGGSVTHGTRGEALKREAIGLGATRFEPKTIFVSCYVFFFVRVQRPPLLQSWQQRRASLDGV